MPETAETPPADDSGDGTRLLFSEHAMPDRKAVPRDKHGLPSPGRSGRNIAGLDAQRGRESGKEEQGFERQVARERTKKKSTKKSKKKAPRRE
jgi:hypothetical protein